MAFTVRPATTADAEGIADAHVDSIRSLGPVAYDAQTVADWGAPRTAETHARRMRDGSQLFVAVDERILGFSGYRVVDSRHRIAVYVRGEAVRNGVGRALFAAAETVARSAGATEIYVDASLLAVPFYKAVGFEEIGPGEHVLRSGRKMACVFMHKRL